MKKLPKKYDPKIAEDKWYQTWMDEGCFKGIIRKEANPFYCDSGLPNVTGILHMGHALNNTIKMCSFA